MESKISGNQLINVVNDLYSGNGTLQFGGMLSIRSSEVREHTKRISVLLSPKKFGTILKDPIEVFAIEYHSDNAPEVVRFRCGHWVQKLVDFHRREMDVLAKIKRGKEEEEIKAHQENLAYELSAFLPIDDSFLIENKKPVKILKICDICKRETMGTWTGGTPGRKLCFNCASNPHPLSIEFIDSYEWISPKDTTSDDYNTCDKCGTIVIASDEAICDKCKCPPTE